MGEIPEHWETKRLKYLIIDLESGVSVNATDNPCEEDDFGILKTSCVYTYSFVPEENKKIWDSELDRANINPRKNSLIISRMNTPELVGASGYVDKDYPNLFLPDRLWQTIVNPQINFSIKYLSFIFISFTFRKKITSLATGSSPSMKNISKGDILGLLSPFPPLDEQESIAHFLEHKTSQIDALIAKKAALIEKLDEKRTALISHAVTKGLDPHVPMKDSGVEWLGEIPEHWDLLPMKRFAEIYDCKHKTVSFVDDGLPVASIAQVQKFYIDLSTANKTTEEEFMEMIEGGRKPRNGDIIFSRNATVGASAIVRDDNFCMGQDVCLIRPVEAHSVFLNYNFYSFFVKTQIDNCLLDSTFKRINVEKVKNLIICLPSLEEQEKITSFIVDKTVEIDRQKAKVKEAIALLKEYRTALITNAVTGKIDVRQGSRV